MERFFVSANNPNDGVGGGGCLCGPNKVEDCKGPYAIFPATETDSNLSPHVVISLHCATAAVRDIRVAVKKGELLQSGTAGGEVDEESL